MEPKICKDQNCIINLFICRKCKRLCCKHFCSNRDDRGYGLCGFCIVAEQNKLKLENITITI